MNSETLPFHEFLLGDNVQDHDTLNPLHAYPPAISISWSANIHGWHPGFQISEAKT